MRACAVLLLMTSAATDWQWQAGSSHASLPPSPLVFRQVNGCRAQTGFLQTKAAQVVGKPCHSIQGIIRRGLVWVVVREEGAAAAAALEGRHGVGTGEGRC
jgi:hypothetical protein